MTVQYQRYGNFAQFDPPAYLRPFVDSFWFHATAANSPAPPDGRRRIIPDSMMGLTFIRKRDVFGAPHRGSVLFAGPATTSQSVRIVPGLEVVGVRIRPEWAEALLDAAPADHLDSFCPLHSLMPDFAVALEDALKRTVRLDQVLLVLSTFLNEQIRRRAGDMVDVDRRAAVFNALRESRGAVALDRIAARLDVPVCALESDIARNTGLSAGRLLAILRLQHAIRICYYTDNPDWHALAADCGYSGRRAMNREVAGLAGVDLEQLHRERRQLLDFANHTPDPAILSADSLMTAISALTGEGTT